MPCGTESNPDRLNQSLHKRSLAEFPGAPNGQTRQEPSQRKAKQWSSQPLLFRAIQLAGPLGPFLIPLSLYIGNESPRNRVNPVFLSKIRSI